MKQLLTSRKATSTIIAIILSIVTVSAIVTGSLIARDYIKKNSYITYQEAIDIASAIPEVATFLEENDITSMSANLKGDVWIVEFYADNINYSRDYYCWMNYAYVEIDATTGDVLFYVVYSPKTQNYTEQEVIEIANAIPEIAEWIENQGGDISINAWYDGYELWYIDYWSDSTRTYPFVIISDIDGSVVYWEIYDPYSQANHTEEEIIQIVEALEIVQQWIAVNPEYERVVTFYETIWFGYNPIMNSQNYHTTIIPPLNETDGGIWVVDYWALDNPYLNWISITVDDDTGEILEIMQNLVPTKTYEEIITIAEAHPEVGAFLDSLVSYTTDAVFDSFYGYWYVYFENDENYLEYATVDIIDATGEIFYYYINDLPDPNLSSAEALAIALANQEVQDYLATITGYEVYSGFSDGYWYIDLIDDALTFNYTFIPGNIIGIRIIIDDITEQVIDVSLIVLEE